MGHKAGKIALGLGLLTGAVTGFLFAPEEGKKVRQKLMKGDTKGLLTDLEHMGDEIKQMVVDLSKTPPVKEALSKAKDKAADMANMKRSELDAYLRKASTKADQFKKKMSAYVKEQKMVLEEHLKETGAVASKAPAKKTKKAVSKKAPAKKAAPKKPVAKKSKKKGKK